jgi:hypothetical protein
MPRKDHPDWPAAKWPISHLRDNGIAAARWVPPLITFPQTEPLGSPVSPSGLLADSSRRRTECLLSGVKRTSLIRSSAAPTLLCAGVSLSQGKSVSPNGSFCRFNRVATRFPKVRFADHLAGPLFISAVDLFQKFGDSSSQQIQQRRCCDRTPADGMRQSQTIPRPNHDTQLRSRPLAPYR